MAASETHDWTQAQAHAAALGPPVPATVPAAFAPVAGLAEAQTYTRTLTHSHYENFSVVSMLLPARLRQDFCNVYAFCRTADDLGDEVGDRALALELLAGFKEQTRAMYAGHTQTAVFTALRQTVQKHQIPAQPFLDLIDAFEQDQRVTRYETFAQVLDYCRRSADPVGRIVLHMCGYHDEPRQKLSDLTCSALQLANFWQDVRRDLLERDRIYLPLESLRAYGVTEEQIRSGAITPEFKAMLKREVDRTAAMFDQGAALLPTLAPVYRKQIALFGQGGRAVLAAIRRQDYDTLTRRPRLSRWQKGRLIASTLAAYLAGMGGRSASPAAETSPGTSAGRPA